MAEPYCCAEGAKEKAPISGATEIRAGFEKLANLSKPPYLIIGAGQTIPALIALHIGEPYLMRWKGGEP